VGLFKESLGPCYSIGVVPNSQSIILSTGDKSLKILDIENKKQAYNFRNVHRRKSTKVIDVSISLSGTIRCVAVSRDGKFFASCSDDRCIKIFDWKTKEVIHWFKNVHRGISQIKSKITCFSRSFLNNRFQSRLQVSRYRVIE